MKSLFGLHKIPESNNAEEMLALLGEVYPRLFQVASNFPNHENKWDIEQVAPLIAHFQILLVMGFSAAYLNGYYAGTNLLLQSESFDAAKFFREHIDTALKDAETPFVEYITNYLREMAEREGVKVETQGAKGEGL